MLHLYALVRNPAELPDAFGLDEAPLRAFPVDGEVDAVVSDAGRRRAGAPTEAEVLAHARVVDAIAAANTAVLPARFAADTSEEDDLRGRLLERRAQLRQALERVDGCVELGLRVLPSERNAERSAPASGREYMQRRLDEIGRVERLLRELHEPLAALARESTSNILARPDVLLTAAYLVPRADVERFRTEVDELHRAHGTVVLVLTGPWPPYSFTLVEGETS